jgi:hypothetical protein
MLNQELKLNLILSGEYLYFLQLVNSQTTMSYTEILIKMMELYKLVYLSNYELALVEGDVIIQKFNTEDLKRRTTNL